MGETMPVQWLPSIADRYWRTFPDYVHSASAEGAKAMGWGLAFASSLAWGQQRLHSWNHACGPAAESGTITAVPDEAKPQPHAARLEPCSGRR